MWDVNNLNLLFELWMFGNIILDRLLDIKVIDSLF